jgi:hypothetical protein
MLHPDIRNCSIVWWNGLGCYISHQEEKHHRMTMRTAFNSHVFCILEYKYLLIFSASTYSLLTFLASACMIKVKDSPYWGCGMAFRKEATLNLGTGIQCSYQHPVTHPTEWSSYNKASSILLCYIPAVILSPNYKLFAFSFIFMLAKKSSCPSVTYAHTTATLVPPISFLVFLLSDFVHIPFLDFSLLIWFLNTFYRLIPTPLSTAYLHYQIWDKTLGWGDLILLGVWFQFPDSLKNLGSVHMLFAKPRGNYWVDCHKWHTRLSGVTAQKITAWISPP